MQHTLKRNRHATAKKTRIARGNSSGQGTTAGRGTKGQQSRSGKGRRFGFEGGQTPLIRRQPKFDGFTSVRKREFEILNIDLLEAKLQPGTYTEDDLRKARIASTHLPIKLLGRGGVKKVFHLTLHAVSHTAKQAIEKAEGSIKLIRP